MSPDEVVSLSLKALENNKKVIVMPGWKNHLYTWLIVHSSIIRSAIQKKVDERGMK
jgi:short-subunit dehydrogenase